MALEEQRATARLVMPDAPAPLPIVKGRERLRVRAVARHRRLIVAEDSDAHGAAALVLAGPDGSRTVLAAINRHLADVDPARAVAIGHRGPDETRLTSWLYLPPPGPAKPPLIVLPYPGTVYGNAPPSDQGTDKTRFYTNAELLAGHGYAVLVPSLPPARRGEPAAGLAQQILGVVDAVAARGLADTSRLGLWGHSFGGYAAGVVATQTDRFRAIVASAGLFDLVSLRGTFAPSRRVAPEDGLSINAMTGWVELGQARLGTTPWADPQTYVRNSPIFAANRIRTPLLLLQGDKDVAPLAQAEEMFSSLYRQNKDAVLVTYWGEGHVVTSPANVRDLYARIFAWFDEHLGPTNEATLIREPGARRSAPPRSAPRIR